MHTDIPAFILARGGSKRVPRKNVRLFCGKPMVSWVVTQALLSGFFSEIIISTDDMLIANAAIKAGAVFHSLRPSELSNDFVGTEEVVAYELESYAKRKGNMPTYSCCLYGTSVFVTPSILRVGKEKIDEQEIDMVMAIIPYCHPVERALIFDELYRLQYRQPACIDVRTQDLPVSYYDAGLFYWIKSSSFLGEAQKKFLPLVRAGVVMDRFSVVDIDTEADWIRAEQLAALNGFPIR